MNEGGNAYFDIGMTLAGVDTSPSFANACHSFVSNQSL
jgi:hypothetical protein